MAPGIFHRGNSGGSRGKSYGLMLLVAFGVAIFGVMVIHKLRERRLFNLLLQQKDSDIISLQLLLQKEREYAKGMKRKTEEMNAKLYSLQNQKMELDGRLLEMQSTIEYIKDEQKLLENTLDVKQNEIKWLRERDADSGKENAKLIDLVENLKQKELEIEDLKRHVESPVKVPTVWSVSSDDPSKSIVSLNETRKYVNLIRGGIESKKNLIHVRESLNASGHASERTETVETLRSKDNVGTAEVENYHILQGKKNENFQEGVSSGIREEKNNTVDTIGENGSNAEKLMSFQGSTISNDGEEIKITEGGKKEELGNHLEGENRQLDVSSKGGMKMEMPNKFKRSADSRGKDGLLTSSKGKRWGMIAQDRLT